MKRENLNIDYKSLTQLLNQKYDTYNRPEFIAPDPLMVVRDYSDTANREFAAFVASQFALGRASCISETARVILDKICAARVAKQHSARWLKPKEALLSLDESELATIFDGFVYRFFDSRDLISLLLSVRSIYKTYGSLENLLALTLQKTHNDLVSALSLFVRELENANPLQTKWKPNLVASPTNGSACKRLMLFLRWMVRTDAVDPGGWSILKPAQLLAPLDTHAIRSYRQLGFIETSAVTIKTVLAVTEHLQNISPDDPLKYDFVLSRPYASCE